MIVWSSLSEAMASLRRALSIQSVQNGSPFGVPSAAGYASTNVSPVPSPTAVNSSGNALSPADAYFPKAGGLALSSVLRGLWYRVSKLGSLEKSKVKATLLRRPLYLLAICFFIGLLCGLTPLSWYEAERDFRLDVNNFPTELEQPGRPLEGTIPGVTPVTGGSSGVGQHRPSKVKSVLTTPRKLLLIITPTYNRPLQAHYLTRLAHTLKLVPPPILWLVVEGQSQSPETAELLRKTGIMYRHLVCNVTLANIKDRGTHERNTALAHIEHHQLDGIVYFADDDNMYTLELFSQLREIKRFGVWPVGMLTPGKSKTILEGPVCDGHEVIGWHTNEKSKKLRRFHVDMSGFGFNSTILWDPQRWGKLSVEPTRQLDSVKEGMQETTFIEQLVEDESQMEGLPSGCSKVMVWHLHFEAPGLPYPSGWTLDEPLKPVVPLH